MRYLGLDLGTKTLGVAVSDSIGLIANPYKTLHFKEYGDLDKEFVAILEEFGIKTVALGLPKNMDNSLGFAAERSLKFKEYLEEKYGLEVALIDERMSTMEAERYLLDADLSREKRKKSIDAVAASVILSTFLRMKGNEANEKRK